MHQGQDDLAALVDPLLARIIPAEGELFGMRPCDEYLFVFGRPDASGLGGSVKAAR